MLLYWKTPNSYRVFPFFFPFSDVIIVVGRCKRGNIFSHTSDKFQVGILLKLYFTSYFFNPHMVPEFHSYTSMSLLVLSVKKALFLLRSCRVAHWTLPQHVERLTKSIHSFIHFSTSLFKQ